MNWMDCPIMERVPGKMSGVPVIKGTRVRPDDITGNEEMGAEWIADAFRLPLETVQTVLAFYRQHERDLADSV